MDKTIKPMYLLVTMEFRKLKAMSGFGILDDGSFRSSGRELRKGWLSQILFMQKRRGAGKSEEGGSGEKIEQVCLMRFYLKQWKVKRKP
ncbi:hypothetical protein [Bartonella massiliensis]|uniref:hypothetical protein n=1 Tax=Bartonella massiliensis TaxID=929795 RepID=UPI0011574B34|nr:hypothetical protein [Bartonella massiliensis]